MLKKRPKPKGPPKKKGPPSKCTAEVREKIIAIVRAGNYDYVAAQAVGVAPETFSRWKLRFPSLRQALLEAESGGEAVQVDRWFKASKTDWRAAMEFLRSKFSDRWGRKDTVQHAAAGDQPIPINVIFERGTGQGNGKDTDES